MYKFENLNILVTVKHSSANIKGIFAQGRKTTGTINTNPPAGTFKSSGDTQPMKAYNCYDADVSTTNISTVSFLFFSKEFLCSKGMLLHIFLFIEGCLGTQCCNVIQRSQFSVGRTFQNWRISNCVSLTLHFIYPQLGQFVKLYNRIIYSYLNYNKWSKTWFWCE